MKVQTKILLLLCFVTALFVGGLVAFRAVERRKLHLLAEQRAVEREQTFAQFMEQRGDRLRAFVEDSSEWDDLVKALQKSDFAWTDANLREETLTTYGMNALWVYRPDRTVFYTLNNRYADNLKALPVPPEALEKLCAAGKPCHFFVHVPQGWMEIRGAPILPSTQNIPGTRARGFLFAGQVWISDYLQRMTEFTEYQLTIKPIQEVAPATGAEEAGIVRFSRAVPGWDGQPVARIFAEHDSPLIRELNAARQRLLRFLLWFAGGLLLVLAAALVYWVRRPLRQLALSLEKGDYPQLAALGKRSDEFGLLAGRMAAIHQTEAQLHSAEEQLRHAQKLEAVGRLAGGIAHDFNNLLTAILGYSQLLERKLAHDPIALEQIRLVFRAGEQAAGLTRQLLAFSRKQILEPKVLDLNALIHDVRKLLQRIIGEHIDVVIENHAADARVLADPGQLEQVLINLGVNARDAMPGGGRLVYRTSVVTLDDAAARVRGGDIVPGRYVALAVCDSGSGMDAETKARLFEPFFTTKGPGRGTGLGLATVYGIVKQSQGAISVESEPGCGCTFLIELPQVTAALTRELPSAAFAQPEPCTETILAVEDEEVVRLVICSVLEDAGYNIICAATPDEALQIVHDHQGPIDLLLTDVVMPGMTGPALAERIVQGFPAIKVLYVSGYSERDMLDQGITDDEIEVLQKPFTHETLVHRVREVLEAKAVAV